MTQTAIGPERALTLVRVLCYHSAEGSGAHAGEGGR